jgi:ribonuclease T2
LGAYSRRAWCHRCHCFNLGLCCFSLLSANGEAQAFERNTPGEFDYYALVLGWAPSYCLTEGRLRRDAECNSAKPRAFVLHGLWPQYEKGWPEDCPIGKRPWVPTSVIDEMRDIMPSKGLIIHEYRTHGTCSGLDPVQYFGVARELYERVKAPESLSASGARQSLSAEEIESAFAAANSWLKPEMMSVSCRGENLLDDRICFSSCACGANEDEARLCRRSSRYAGEAALRSGRSASCDRCWRRDRSRTGRRDSSPSRS